MNNYNDIDLNFGVTINGDIARKLDDKSVLQSLKNIVMIRNKLFNPRWGAGTENYLFANADEITLNNLRDNIEIAIRKNEPRISYLRLKLENDLDNHRIVININYSMKFSVVIYTNQIFLRFLK
jgi:phage baseplate assembly protein W